MPPWYIERNVGVRTFKEDVSLTDEEIATIGRWVDAGAPRGNPADAPPPVQLASLDEWRIGTPEWIVEIPEEQIIGALDADHWLNVWADSGLTEDRYIKVVETKPSAGAYRVVHHVATSMRWEEEDGEEGGGFLNEYAVGKNGDIFPDGTGRLIKAGTQIRFNMHYSSVGEEITDRTRVGFQFYPEGYVPDRVLISRHVGDSFDTLDIPVGPNNFLEPGDLDRGQPTYFYPRWQRVVWRVRVPADWGDKELVWSVTAHGRTDTAVGWLVPEQIIDEQVLAMNRSGGGAPDIANRVPSIALIEGQQRTVAVGEPLTLTTVITDDGVPPMRPARNSRPPGRRNALGLRLAWIQYRGPGTVTFDPFTPPMADHTPGWTPPPIPADGKIVTTARFSEPGTYVIRGMADDGYLYTPADVTVTVTP